MSKKRTKRRFGKTKRTTRAIAKKALFLAKKPTFIIHTDRNVTGDASTAGVIQILSSVAQGLTEHTRRGEETLLLSARFRYWITSHASSTNSIVRIIVFRDLEKQTAATVSGDVNSVLESANITSPIRQDNKSRFIILKDFYVGVTLASQRQKHGHFYLPLRKVKARYDGVADTDNTSGHLYILMLSNESTNHPNTEIRARVYMDVA